MILTESTVSEERAALIVGTYLSAEIDAAAAGLLPESERWVGVVEFEFEVEVAVSGVCGIKVWEGEVVLVGRCCGFGGMAKSNEDIEGCCDEEEGSRHCEMLR